jgi:hypothetical protein
LAVDSSSESLESELLRRHRSAANIVVSLLALTIILVAGAFALRSRFVYQPDPRAGLLWIAILVLGLGALLLRRTKFAAMRLQDIAAVRGPSALLKTLQSTTIQVAAIGGAIALMGLVITVLEGNEFDMLRAGGVAAIILVYSFPMRGTWQRVLTRLARN